MPRADRPAVWANSVLVENWTGQVNRLAVRCPRRLRVVAERFSSTTVQFTEAFMDEWRPACFDFARYQVPVNVALSIIPVISRQTAFNPNWHQELHSYDPRDRDDRTGRGKAGRLFARVSRAGPQGAGRGGMPRIRSDGRCRQRYCRARRAPRRRGDGRREMERSGGAQSPPGRAPYGGIPPARQNAGQLYEATDPGAGLNLHFTLAKPKMALHHIRCQPQPGISSFRSLLPKRFTASLLLIYVLPRVRSPSKSSGDRSGRWRRMWQKPPGPAALCKTCRRNRRRRHCGPSGADGTSCQAQTSRSIWRGRVHFGRRSQPFSNWPVGIWFRATAAGGPEKTGRHRSPPNFRDFSPPGRPGSIAP